jgi:hypothetical protein
MVKLSGSSALTKLAFANFYLFEGLGKFSQDTDRKKILESKNSH